MAFGLGPEAEILIIGLNNLNNSYYSMFTNPYSAGDIRHGGLNRNYFNKPSYGIKLSLVIGFKKKKDVLPLDTPN